MKHTSYDAFHVLWTKPYMVNGENFCMNDAELLTMVVSALMWQKYNGTIKLYTDNRGYEFIRKHGLLSLWDMGIDKDVLENNTYPIDPEIFWAAGKLLALENQKGSCIMLDTDLIVVRSIHEKLEQTVITALHSELLEPDVYLQPCLLKQPLDFQFPESYNWTVAPSNTSFLFIRDENFKKFYLKESKQFMFNNYEKPKELVSQMVFAEQRMLSICADYSGLPVSYLITDPFSVSNRDVIHLWGFKSLLRENKKIQILYVKQLLNTVGKELSANSFFLHFLKIHFPNQLINQLTN